MVFLQFIFNPNTFESFKESELKLSSDTSKSLFHNILEATSQSLYNGLQLKMKIKFLSIFSELSIPDSCCLNVLIL